jgi:hypothetical protein
MYPGIGKCADLDNLTQKTVQDEPSDEDRMRRFAKNLVLFISWALLIDIVIMSVLGYSCFKRLL